MMAAGVLQMGMDVITATVDDGHHDGYATLDIERPAPRNEIVELYETDRRLADHIARFNSNGDLALGQDVRN